MPEALKGISSMATGELLCRLAAAYEADTGVQVTFESIGGVDAAKRVSTGELFDVVVLASNAIDKLSAGDKLEADTKLDLVRSTTAIALRADAPVQPIDSAAALRKVVENSPSVGYSTGPSGQAIVKLLAQWGITTDSVEPKLVQAKPGSPVGQLIAAGDVAIGFQQLSELLNVSGIQILGAMPPGLEIETIFSGAVSKSSTSPEAAQRFLQYLGAEHTAVQKRRLGMEPI